MVSGEGVVTLEGKEVALREGQSIDIPLGGIHRMSNKTNKDIVFIEVQRGDYFGEDDIERLEDDYGRE